MSLQFLPRLALNLRGGITPWVVLDLVLKFQCAMNKSLDPMSIFSVGE